MGSLYWTLPLELILLLRTARIDSMYTSGPAAMRALALIFLLPYLVKGDNLGFASCERTSYNGPDLDIAVTADNQMDAIYADGKIIATEISDLWVADIVNAPGNIGVLAVKATDRGNNGGLLLSASSGIITNSTNWKCVAAAKENWFEYDFDDSDWPAAVEYGRNGDSPAPWKKVIAGIDEEARWIWTSEQKDDNIIYCRFVADQYLYFTADNRVDSLYADGELMETEPSIWQDIDSVVIPGNTRVIAIQVTDVGRKGGMIMSSSLGLMSNCQWRCTTNPADNWYERDFDASDWPAAVVYGRNGDSPAPWNRVFADIAEDAQWIWTADAENDDLVYCRVIV